MFQTLDSQVVLLLCSHLGLSSLSPSNPLTLREWNTIVKKLSINSSRPRDLLGATSDNIQARYNLSKDEAERILFLLERIGTLAIEIERLESLGIHIITRADPEYPERYRQRLKDSAPTILYYAGEKELIGQPGIAVVGSRNLDNTGMSSAEFVGNACGISGLVLYSGGAKGVDSISMNSALEARGTGVGILADSLERTIRDPKNRNALQRGDLCLFSQYSPNAPFSVGSAMGRNKLIYSLADFAIVVASDVEKGGTWAGATEAIRSNWVPVFVLHHKNMPEGNLRLIEKGGIRIDFPFPASPKELYQWLEQNNHQETTNLSYEQASLFR